MELSSSPITNGRLCLAVPRRHAAVGARCMPSELEQVHEYRLENNGRSFWFAILSLTVISALTYLANFIVNFALLVHDNGLAYSLQDAALEHALYLDGRIWTRPVALVFLGLFIAWLIYQFGRYSQRRSLRQ